MAGAIAKVGSSLGKMGKMGMEGLKKLKTVSTELGKRTKNGLVRVRDMRRPGLRVGEVKPRAMSDLRRPGRTAGDHGRPEARIFRRTADGLLRIRDIRR